MPISRTNTTKTKTKHVNKQQHCVHNFQHMNLKFFSEIKWHKNCGLCRDQEKQRSTRAAESESER